MFKKTFLIILFPFIMSCSSVTVPVSKPIPENMQLKKEDLNRWISSPPAPEKILRAEYNVEPPGSIDLPKAGESNTFGVKMTPELEQAFNNYFNGDGDNALKALEAAAQTSLNPGQRWQVSFLKAQAYLMMGRAADAEIELHQTAQFEIEFMGHNLNSKALSGEIKVWLEDYEGAKKEFAHVIKAIGAWELPILYSSFPDNRTQLYSFTTAKLRSYTALAGVYIFEEKFEAALRWAQETERLFNNVHFVNNHPIYGMGDKTYADSYYGRAMNLMFLASATLAVTKNIEESEKLYDYAHGFFNSIGYSAGQVTVMAIKAYIYNYLGMDLKALEVAKKAVQLATDKGLPDYVWRIKAVTGKTLLRHGLKDEAEKEFRQAQASVDLISGSLSADRAKIRFGVGKEDITYHLAQLDIEKQDWKTLFNDLERGRARSFVDMMAERPIVSGRETSLMQEIRELEKKILKQRLINMSPGAADTKDIHKEKQLTQKRQRLVDQLRKRDPELADLVSISTQNLEDV